MRRTNIDLPNNQNPGLNWSAICKGTLITSIAVLPLGLIAGIIYYLTSLSESTMPFVVAGILALSVFSGGFVAAGQAGAKGLFHGLGVAILFFCIVLIISILFIPSSISPGGLITKLLLLLSMGSLGGVIGVTRLH